jgi:hypothetical protein
MHLGVSLVYVGKQYLEYKNSRHFIYEDKADKSLNLPI